MPEESIRFLELNLGSCELSDMCLEAQRGSSVRAVCNPVTEPSPQLLGTF